MATNYRIDKNSASPLVDEQKEEAKSQTER